MKKIVILIIIIVVGAGVYYFLFNNKEDDFSALEFDEINFKEFDLFFSSLAPAQIPYIELEEGAGIDIEGIKFDGVREATTTPAPSISFDASVFDVSSPIIDSSNMGKIKIDTPSEGGGAPPSGQWSPNSSDCSRFVAAPSCSYVPEANRQMCEDCKKAGY